MDPSWQTSAPWNPPFRRTPFVDSFILPRNSSKADSSGPSLANAIALVEVSRRWGMVLLWEELHEASWRFGGSGVFDSCQNSWLVLLLRTWNLQNRKVSFRAKHGHQTEGVVQHLFFGVRQQTPNRKGCGARALPRCLDHRAGVRKG